MPRTYLFQENVYPILVRELMEHEDVLRRNNKKALKAILKDVIIDGSPLSERERSSLMFIEGNRERLLEDIRVMKRNPRAVVHHPSAPTYPAKMRLVATALLACAEQFRKKDYNPVFRSIVKKEVAELMSKSGVRVNNLENYFTDYRERLLELMDEIEVERRDQVDKENKASSSNESKVEAPEKLVTEQQEGGSDDKRAVSKDKVPQQEENIAPDKAPDEDQSAQGGAASPVDDEKAVSGDNDKPPKEEAASDESPQQDPTLLAQRPTSPGKNVDPEKPGEYEATTEASQPATARSAEQSPEVSTSSKGSSKSRPIKMEESVAKVEDSPQLDETLKLPESPNSQRSQAAVQHGGQEASMEVGPSAAKDKNSSEDEEFAGFKAADITGGDAVATDEEISQGAKSSGSSRRLPEPFEEEDDFLEFRVKSLELNEWSVGQLAWAPITDFVYWPCIVVADETGEQVRTQHFGEKTVTLIHVKYFGENGGYSWVNRNSLIECSGPDDVARMAEIFTAAVKELQHMMNRDATERIVALGGGRKRVHPPSSQETHAKRMRLDGDGMEV